MQAADQTTYFQEFQQGYASGGSDAAIFNDRRDLKLVLEIEDIMDELKVRVSCMETRGICTDFILHLGR